MSDFIPQLPSNRPKVDLAEQERIIAQWVAKGGVIKRTPETMPKPRPAHRVHKPSAMAVYKAKRVIKRIQSESGLSAKSFDVMMNHDFGEKQEIKQVIKSQFGLTLTTVKKYDCNGKIKLMMGLRK